MADNFLNVTCQFRWSTLYATTSAPVIILFPFNSMDTSLYSQRHLSILLLNFISPPRLYLPQDSSLTLTHSLVVCIFP